MVERFDRAATVCMTPVNPMGPLGCRYDNEDGLWQIDLYPTPIELVGGAADGAVVVPGFILDIDTLRGLFDRVDAVSWESWVFQW